MRSSICGAVLYTQVCIYHTYDLVFLGQRVGKMNKIGTPDALIGSRVEEETFLSKEISLSRKKLQRRANSSNRRFRVEDHVARAIILFHRIAK